jgi:spore coat protein H
MSARHPAPRRPAEALIALASMALFACGTQTSPDPDRTPPAAAPTLLINELVSVGGQGIDWLELWNPGEEAVSLAGWSLQDGAPDSNDGGPEPLDPSLAVPAGGFLVLLADGSPELGPTHLPFRLSSEGERIQLFDGSDRIDDVTFGPLLREVSLARNGDGSHDWEVRGAPSPGASNPVGDPPLPASDAAPTCAPSAEAGAADLLEGDAIEVSLACGAGDLDAFDVRTLSAGPAGQWDGHAWTATAGPGDAGAAAVLFAVKPAGSGGMPETAVATFDVIDDWTAPGNVPPDPETYVREWGLPVLHLIPEGEVTQSYSPGAAWFDGVRYDLTLKIRGASSADFPKNHFTVEFEPTQIDLTAVGLGRKDHLVLISTFDDNAHVRQKVIYDVWEEMAEFRGVPRLAPRTAFVVVYLGGAYHGLYIAIDHVDDEFLEEMGDGSTNLYKSVSHDANFWLTAANGNPKGDLTAGWEKKEGPTDDWSDLTGLTAWAGAGTPASFAAEASDWIALDEFEDWLLLVHHFAANDSAGKNAYLANDPEGGRFRYVPWDFNHSLGQDWRTLRVSAESHTHFESTNAIFSHIVNEPAIAAETWAHYAALRAPGAPLSASSLLALTEGYYAAIDRSAARDWDKWADAYASFGRWASERQGDLLDYEGERAYLEQWIVDRDAAMEILHPVAGR